MVDSSIFRFPREHRCHVHQEHKLRQYLAAGGLLAAHGGSQFGAQLERAEKQGSFYPCKRCGGDPSDDNKPGRGFVPRTLGIYRKRLAEYRRHWRERGVKQAPSEFLSLSICDIKVCPRCEGTGWAARRAHKQITAQPTAELRGGGVGHMLDDTSAQIVGRVGRWLARVAVQDWIGSQALEAYFGPGGDFRSVWPLTPAGQTMLRRRKPDEGPAQCLDRLERVNREFHDIQVTNLIQQADSGARSLVERGCAIWDTVVPDEFEAVESGFWQEAAACSL